jgi:hypothetical protein
MASLSEAFPSPNNDAKLFENTENPQTYDETHDLERRYVAYTDLVELVEKNLHLFHVLVRRMAFLLT